MVTIAVVRKNKSANLVCVNSFFLDPSLFIFFKWAKPDLFFVYFQSFQTNHTIFTTNQFEKCPSSLRRQDLNPRPLEHESSPLTTRPGHIVFSCRQNFFQRSVALLVCKYLVIGHW